MRLWICTAAVALGLAPAPARADEDTARALKALKAVAKEGKGNEDAGPAWKTLVSQGGPALFLALGAFDDDNVAVTNWLRTAVDAIAEGEHAAGRKLPADKLEAFVKDTKNAATARRAAYELLAAQDEAVKARLLPGFLNDKSPDLRRDAVANELAILEKAAKPSLKADLEKLFAHARDKDQVDLLAKKIADAGGKVSVTEHFGFVTHVALVGPFDSTGGKGFAVAYPPEGARDASGKFPGKGGAEVKWQPADTRDKYGTFDLNTLLGKHKDAVAYAQAVVVAGAETPCEIRATCATATQIFLNGKLLCAHEEYHHGAPFDSHVGKGTLRKGENVLTLKVCQNNQTEQWAQTWAFQVRVCDPTGGPLPLEQKVTTDGRERTIKLGFVPEGGEKKEEKK
ncbi:hypothetical protein R5W24_001135 [Gemmata sp. JC717]|uniref:hypothetical protein n=1 Tax=Gemmata algarum TaxID=2975278 RepID=UPI0021BA6E69|nr:hypothetical protein [Gemmata algarum]MDY3552055.1 hypothetical protein [Gemmata algarum]